MKFENIIIGAGPNGLTAAAYLAKRGRKSYVVDGAVFSGGHTRFSQVGSEAIGAPLNFDGGALLPNVASELGISALPQLAADALAFSIAAPDGSLMSVPVNANDTESLARHSKKDAERWPRFVAQFSRFAEILGRLYQLAPPDIETTSLGDVLPLAAVALRTRALGRADMIEFLRVPPMSIQDYVDDAFESELLKTAIAANAIRDLRQGPRSGGTTFNLLHHMVGVSHIGGRPWPASFYAAVKKPNQAHDVSIRPQARVARILVKDNAVTGVALESGEEIRASTVISTADPKETLLKLIEPQWLDPEIGLAVQNIKLRGCTAYVMYATDLEPPAAFRAPVILTSTTVALEKAADAAKYGEISANPHVEVWSPSLRWPTNRNAPDGVHTVVARVQFAPYALASGDWTAKDSAALEAKTTEAIKRVFARFADSVKHVRVLTPVDLEKEYGVTEGAMTHGEVTLDQILFMRPIPGWSRYAMPIRGLFLGGSGAHPGPGILGGAGYLAAKAALNAK